jgi:hypothetical protein
MKGVQYQICFFSISSSDVRDKIVELADVVCAVVGLATGRAWGFIRTMGTGTAWV